MAEEEKAEQAQAKVGIVKKLVTVGLIVLVPAIAGLGTFMFVLRPMFAEPETVENDSGKIPPTTVMVDFKGLRASVLVEESELSSPALLQYSVALACANQKTALLVESWNQMFVAILVELHDSRTKAELNDPVVKESILRQAKQEANALLKRVQEKEDPTVEIIEVMYTEYTVIEL